MSEWISVDDEKPKKFDLVLLYEPGGLDHVAGYWDGDDFVEPLETMVIFATHWMPLPEPPDATP